MTTDMNPNEVLHSQHPTALSAEEIAKAVTRHNRHHPSGRSENTAVKAKKPGKR